MTGPNQATCPAQHPHQRGERLVDCGLPAGHDGLHAEEPGAPEWEAPTAAPDELRDRRNEDLALRGALAPQGRPDRIIPFELGPSLVPAVEWLIGEIDTLRARHDRIKAERQTLAERLDDAQAMSERETNAYMLLRADRDDLRNQLNQACEQLDAARAMSNALVHAATGAGRDNLQTQLDRTTEQRDTWLAMYREAIRDLNAALAERDEATATVETLAGELARERSLHQDTMTHLNAMRTALALLRDMADNEPCDYDHNDGCQTHFSSRPCANARALDLIASVDAHDKEMDDASDDQPTSMPNPCPVCGEQVTGWTSEPTMRSTNRGFVEVIAVATKYEPCGHVIRKMVDREETDDA